jgi:hypothetical protein
LNSQSTPPSRAESALPAPAAAAILEAIGSLQYGSVEITIHDSRVVQIECKKKIRFQVADSKES